MQLIVKIQIGFGI